MATRPVLTYPDARLRTVAAPVTAFDAALAELVTDLFDTMAFEGGVGIAATQIDVHLRVLVMDCGRDEPRPLVFVNPEIVARDGEIVWSEGCLSVPGARADVDRAEAVTVRFCDLQGQPQIIELAGLEAVCLQHEVDHLDGRLYIDRLGELERRAVLADRDAPAAG
ncbi:MAG: peptide deformylase [Myxococcales bacterium]|nr:peptide deformylase [Myxococcales bacterium]